MHVVIPVLRWSAPLERCLASLLESGHAPGATTVVFDGRPAAEEAQAAAVRAIALEQNRGFAAACNAGFLDALRTHVAVGADQLAVLFVNDDVELARNWRRAVDVLQDECVGAVGFRSRGPGGKRPAYPGREVAGGTALSGPTLDGCAFAVRADVFRALGGFDESYRMYGEETDLFSRLQRAGLLLIESDVEVWHQGEATMSNLPLRRAWYGMRNPIRWALLNGGPWQVLRSAVSLLVHAAAPARVRFPAVAHIERKRGLPLVVRLPLAIAAIASLVPTIPSLMSRRMRRRGRYNARQGHLGVTRAGRSQ